MLLRVLRHGVWLAPGLAVWLLYERWFDSGQQIRVTAASLGLSPVQLLDLMIKALGAVAVVASAYYGGRKFLVERRDDRRWRTTELVSRLGHEFDTDPRIQKAIMAITAFRHAAERPDLERVLGPDASDLSSSELELRLALDRFLDFLDRLYTYLYLTEALEPEQLLSFSYFAEEVTQIPPLCRYATECGFAVVPQLAKKLTMERKRLGLANDGRAG